eukprot:4249948-Amphidinium_carterae.1
MPTPSNGIQTMLTRTNPTFGSRTVNSGTMTGTIVVDLQSLMWEAVVSRQCAPMILDLLLATEYVPQDDTKGNADHLRDLTNVSNTATIQRETFIPTAAMNNLNIHLWFTWLTEVRYNDFKATGTVPGYKDTRGDTVHRHHRLHNTPDHCINLHIHNRWNAAADNDTYASKKPIYLLAWKTSINNILAHSF